MAITIQLRRGTAAEWTTANPILSSGEIGVETDTLQFKIGDGAAAWIALSYAGSGSTEGGASAENQVESIAQLALLLSQTDGIEASLSTIGAALAGTLAVSGTFWQATQPVSGSVAVSNLSATQPVSGTFWQATQPVSGTLTATGTLAIDQTTPGTTDSVTVKASAGVGALTETAPASDTASSGLNGRLQRIAQNVTSLIAKFVLDSTDRLRVSMYGKVTAAGDTAILLSPAGRQMVAFGTANSAGASITGGTIAPNDNTDTARALATAQFRYNGATNEPLRNPNVFKVVALAAGTTETTLWTPTSAKKFRLMGFLLTCGAGSTLTFKDNTGGTTIFAARGATDAPISPNGLGNGILSAAANNVLTVTRSVSATLDGVVWGCEE